jgi:hypothetical protein
MSKRLSLEEVKNKFESVHGQKYDYGKVIYAGSQKKVEIVCPIHGSFFQIPSDHMRGCGCQQCGRDLTGLKKRNDTEWFLKESKDRHGDIYNYSMTNYVKSSDRVKIICGKHGEFEQLPFEHLKGRGCLKCSYEYRKLLLMDNSKSFINKSLSVHGITYDYSEVDYVDSWTPVSIKCRHHGIFRQIPNAHINSKAGCPKCGKEKCGDKLRKTTEQYIGDCIKVHGNRYDYSNVFYTKSSDKVKIICPTHGLFSIRAGDHLHNGRGCMKCSSFESKPEIFIEEILKQYNINYKKNDRTNIYPLELDFYLPDTKIAIEFNGFYYHSEITGNKDNKYHLNKTNLCDTLGIRLIHIFEDEYNNNRLLLKSKLENLLGVNKYKIYARKCSIKVIDSSTKKKFIEKYHIQGDSNSCVNLGLFSKNRLVQVMTFSKKRKALGSNPIEGEYELSRMCSIKGFNIVGGASKLLKFFETTYHPRQLVSYADKRWSVGNIYHQLGFTKTHVSKPNYWYFSINNNCKKWHRYMFAKHTLVKKLKIFDPSISEWENMKNNNYDRIWDCGNLVFEKNY